MLTKGDSGPLGLDAARWRRILTSIQFWNSPSDILKDFANLIKKLCSEELESTQSLEALTAIRLIPLDKNPDSGPIGVGEALKRMRDISADIDTDAVLLMDAENALNSMNRNVMQLHQGYFCRWGRDTFYWGNNSRTTQGDSAAMRTYASDILLLIV